MPQMQEAKLFIPQVSGQGPVLPPESEFLYKYSARAVWELELSHCYGVCSMAAVAGSIFNGTGICRGTIFPRVRPSICAREVPFMKNPNHRSVDYAGI